MNPQTSDYSHGTRPCAVEVCSEASDARFRMPVCARCKRIALPRAVILLTATPRGVLASRCDVSQLPRWLTTVREIGNAAYAATSQGSRLTGAACKRGPRKEFPASGHGASPKSDGVVGRSPCLARQAAKASRRTRRCSYYVTKQLRVLGYLSAQVLTSPIERTESYIHVLESLDLDNIVLLVYKRSCRRLPKSRDPSPFKDWRPITILQIAWQLASTL